jgi:chorismate mutase
MTEHRVSLDLNHVAAHLEALEETIISKLIDRAQFRENPIVYEAGKSGFAGEATRCLFDVRMHYHEQMDALFGRFCVPEERPFCRTLPEPLRKVTLPDTGLHIDDFDKVNYTAQIRTRYVELAARLCRPGDDGQYGSSVEHDVYAIQAISRRIHYGAFYVAECKYRSAPEQFGALVEQLDIDMIGKLLTRQEVEDRIISRVAQKTIEMQKAVNPELRHVINPELIVHFYRETVIPLTKLGEIDYLLHRRRKTGDRTAAGPVYNM